MDLFPERGYETGMLAVVLPGCGDSDSSQGQGDDMKIHHAGEKRHWYVRVIAGMTVFLIAVSLGLAGPAFSDDLRVVNGIVNGVSGKYIIVDGKQYDVAGVPVITKGSRNRGNKAGIGQGDMVWLSLRDGKVVSIRNYGAVLQ
jgi:hypothetical protein